MTDHVWTLGELIGLLEVAENVPYKHGSYAKTRIVKRRPRFRLTHNPKPD